MKAFNYSHPTEIRFGWGRVAEVGEVVARYGKRCLIVSGSSGHALLPLYERIKQFLTAAGIEVGHFSGVIPNPTAEVVSAGAALAQEMDADVVLGVGGVEHRHGQSHRCRGCPPRQRVGLLVLS